jgi:hypothetical protein
MSGFGWDDGRKLVTADDEHWENLAKACFRTFREEYHVFMLTALVTEGPTDPEMEENSISHLR